MKKASNKNKLIMDKKAMGLAIVFLIITCLTLCLDEYWVIKPSQTPSLFAEKTIIINILTTVASGCGLSAAWEIICKRSFAQEILTLNKMSDSCYESGIEYVYEDYNDVDWYSELRNVEELTILFCYGYTWRNHNRTLLRDFLGRGGKLTVIMPDYSCQEIIDELDMRFGFGAYCHTSNKPSTKDRIIEAQADFIQMGAEVKFFRRTLCSLYYLMEDKAILVPFRHCEQKITYPAIRVSNHGCLYRFIADDLSNIVLFDKPKNSP